MKALHAVHGSVWFFAASGAGATLTACGSDFTCVESRTCPAGVARGGSGGSSGSGAAGSAGAQGMIADSGVGDAGSGGPLGEAGSADGGGTEADVGPDAEAGSDAGRDAPSCETEQPNRERGIFVSRSGGDGADGGTCGAIEAPCATIKKALGLAKANSAIYLDAGIYEEDGLALVPGVTLQGGWERRVNGAWTRICTQGRESATVIRATSADRTLSAVDLGGHAKLELVTIRSKLGPATAEQSLYGIFAAGPTTQLTLHDVAIEVGNAGAGKPGVAGADGGRRGRFCSPETGADGAAVGPSGAGAPAGSFTVGGYVAASGKEGGAGSDGADGTAPPPAPCVACRGASATCSVGCAGTACLCAWSSSYAECGDAGRQGCAGGGGGGGKPGSGGGSSVGIFVWGANVRFESGKVQAGRGGDGGAGGPGGQGGVGTPGTPGSAPGATCEACFGNVALGCGVAWQAAAPGGPGGPGGSGKAGGAGGGGSGGHSYAIYKDGSAMVSVATGVDLVAGAPGDGGGTAPGRGADGAAKPIGP